MDLSVILLHDNMLDKRGNTVTTSITLIDLHDISRSSRTYGATKFYAAHPAPSMRKLARTLKSHWEEGYGATYNTKRKEALSFLEIVTELDEAISDIERRTGRVPKLIATCGKEGGKRVTFSQMKEIMAEEKMPFLLMLGTGWGMTQELFDRADYFLEPIRGKTPFNHLSVRSAAAVLLDRLVF